MRPNVREIRGCIGRAKEEWRTTLDHELQSHYETGTLYEATHVPRGREVLPMKMVLTLNTIQRYLFVEKFRYLVFNGGS